MSLTATATRAAASAFSPFDLDVRTIEQAGIAAQISLTDDGCGSTCPNACTSSV